jgi:predicted CDP-diglyceride synthetase/phosphatidate cytidylyltransferase
MSVMTVIEPTLLKRRVEDALDDAILRFDGWWLVLIAVFLVFGVAFLASLATWCFLANGGKRFTGSWNWGKSGVSVWLECV